MSTSPSSLAWRRVSAQLRLAGGAQRVDGVAALGTGLGGEPVVAVDAVGAEGVERPVLQEDVHRPAERGRAGGQHGRSLSLSSVPEKSTRLIGSSMARTSARGGRDLGRSRGLWVGA